MAMNPVNYLSALTHLTSENANLRRELEGKQNEIE